MFVTRFQVFVLSGQIQNILARMFSHKFGDSKPVNLALGTSRSASQAFHVPPALPPTTTIPITLPRPLPLSSRAPYHLSSPPRLPPSTPRLPHPLPLPTPPHPLSLPASSPGTSPAFHSARSPYSAPPPPTPPHHANPSKHRKIPKNPIKPLIR